MNTLEYLVYYIAVGDSKKTLENLLWLYDYKPTVATKLVISEHIVRIDAKMNTDMLNSISIMDNPYVRDLLVVNASYLKTLNKDKIYLLVNEILHIINRFHAKTISKAYLVDRYDELCNEYARDVFLLVESEEHEVTSLLSNTTRIYKNLLNTID